MNSSNSMNSSNTLNKVLPLSRAPFLGVDVLLFCCCAVKNYLTATRLNCNTAAHDVVTAALQNRSTAVLLYAMRYLSSVADLRRMDALCPMRYANESGEQK